MYMDALHRITIVYMVRWGTPSEEGMYMDAQVYYSIYGQMEPLVSRGCIWMHTGIPNSDFNYNDN